jgi:hypothetical protein
MRHDVTHILMSLKNNVKGTEKDIYEIRKNENKSKFVTGQWRGSLGVRDSESCWFTEEIGTYMHSWESRGDLPFVIDIFVYFRSFRCAPLANKHKIYITRGRSPGLSQERMYVFLDCRLVVIQRQMMYS